MQTGRFINKLADNVLAYYYTPNYEQLLTKQNLEFVWNQTQSGTNIFPEDLAITYTTITPEFDGSRLILANDTVILKFADSELTKFLVDSEKKILLDRANATLNLPSRVQAFQKNNGQALSNPLPEVKL